MNIGARIIFIFLAVLGLLGAVVVSMNFLAASSQLTADAEQRRFQSRKLADQLRQSSDDLTRMARTYAVTGDEIYERYFFEILAIRNGTSPRPKNYDGIYWDFVTATNQAPTSPGAPVALIDLMKQVGLTNQELAKLEEAKNNSDELSNLEKTAFGAMKGLFADDTGKLTVKGPPNPAFAREILHGDQYHRAKAEIMRPIGEFLDLLDQRTLHEVAVNRADENRYRNFTYVLIGLTILVSILAFFHIRKNITIPIISLSNIAGRIRSGAMNERAIVTSDDEIGTLNNAFNEMTDKTIEMIAGLKIQIAERELAEESLKASEARMTEILSIAPQAVVTVGADMNIQIFNQGAERIFGYKADDILGRPLDILIPVSSREGHRRKVVNFRELGETHFTMDQRQEIFGLRKDGVEFPASASVSKLDIGGEKIFTVMLQDITGRRQTEEDRRLALIEAKHANQAKSEFLATMSHELRTPLNAIIGFSEMMTTEVFGALGSPKYLEYAGDILTSSDHLLRLINDILDLSAIEAGKHPLTRESLNAIDVIEDCSAIIAAAADHKGITYAVEASGNPTPLYADRRALKQILLNVLSNAVKFTPERGKVTINATESNTHHVFEVSDTGDGIPADRLSGITNPFTRSETDPQKAQEGTGLGLSIVKSLVDLHNGELTIESEVGKGTTVTVTLPSGAS